MSAITFILAVLLALVAGVVVGNFARRGRKGGDV